ncbi:hypothetical protein C7M84_000554 [Penaeus vannamei]|uniref:Uncharacterized protein n=1 Tax=Penaeus vannamei TaxID=6689 RepID=A0A423TW61_PENVA|nr:hypothetical protein C7M84_000554 [Penaeus vannamei]
MGCGESKDVQQISVSAAQKKLEDSLKDLDVVRLSSASSSSGLGSTGSGSAPNSPGDDEASLFHQESVDSLGALPTTLDNIPNSDLGESLDCRRGVSLWPKPPAAPPSSSVFPPASSSARSNDSSDSGIYDLDDDYSFVITENSPPELVQRVVADFTPVENLGDDQGLLGRSPAGGRDLTLTGKQCPRLLSGYQRARQEEAEILKSLREDGLISTSKQRAGGGVSFEIIEATPATESSTSSKFKPKDFLPEETKQHLEAQRNKFHLRNLTSADVSRKMHMAEQRRQGKQAERSPRAGRARDPRRHGRGGAKATVAADHWSAQHVRRHWLRDETFNEPPLFSGSLPRKSGAIYGEPFGESSWHF